jgi:hypothetical protein
MTGENAGYAGFFYLFCESCDGKLKNKMEMR